MKGDYPAVSAEKVIRHLTGTKDGDDLLFDRSRIVGIYIGAIYETPIGKRMTGIDLKADTAAHLIGSAREQNEDPQVMIGWALDCIARGEFTFDPKTDAQ
tara:strand:+ start:9104 stop:9403 length:300 start_codon:yes stop_codon:yes gene_type:complete